MDEQQKAGFARCAEMLAREPLQPSAPDARTCFDFRPGYSDKLRAALAAAETPARMRNKIAQIEGIAVGSAATLDPSRNYGAIALIVLTRGQLGPPPGGPPPGMPVEEATGGLRWTGRGSQHMKPWRSYPRAASVVRLQVQAT